MLPHDGSFPMQEAKVRILWVGPRDDEFAGGFAGHGVEQDILPHGE